MRAAVLPILLLILGVLIYTQITLFVVPPIGAVPEGRMIVLWRYSINRDGQVKGLNLQFIDSADAVYRRTMRYVYLLCRGITLRAVVGNSTILLRLPYNAICIH